jgi:hypothetical protein
MTEANCAKLHLRKIWACFVAWRGSAAALPWLNSAATPPYRNKTGKLCLQQPILFILPKTSGD